MTAFVAGTTVAVLAGVLAWAVGARRVADVVWAVTTLTALVPTVFWVAQALSQRRTGVDAVAVLALVGTLVIGEYLAGALIAAMLATGRALESYAERRARRNLTAQRPDRVALRAVRGAAPAFRPGGGELLLAGAERPSPASR